MWAMAGPFQMRCFGAHQSDWQERADRFFLTLERLEDARELDECEHPAVVIDAPIDERSVLWRVIAYYHQDGSNREVVKDVRLPEARLYALALLGLNDRQLKVDVESRLCDAIGPVPVPDGLNWLDCCQYPGTSYGLDSFKPGIVDNLL